MLKLYRNVVMVGLVGLGLAACGDKVTVTQPVTPTPGVTSVSVAPQNLTIAIYLEKIRVFQAGLRRNTLAWNNRIGL